MKSLNFRFDLVLCFIFTLAINAIAQQNPKPQTGSAILSGTIYDVNGAVIPKVKIVFQNNLNETFSAESNDEGIYSIELPFNLTDLNSTKTGSQILKYKITVDLTGRGFQKKVIEDFSFVSPLKGKMILDIALDSHDPEPCGYAGADCISSEPIEKDSTIKLPDKVVPKPAEKSPADLNKNNRKNR